MQMQPVAGDLLTKTFAIRHGLGCRHIPHDRHTAEGFPASPVCFLFAAGYVFSEPAGHDDLAR